MRPHLRGLVDGKLSYEWIHPDLRMESLHAEVSAAVEFAVTNNWSHDRAFLRVKQLAFSAAQGTAPENISFRVSSSVSRPLRLTEPWFC